MEPVVWTCFDEPDADGVEIRMMNCFVLVFCSSRWRDVAHAVNDKKTDPNIAVSLFGAVRATLRIWKFCQPPTPFWTATPSGAAGWLAKCTRNKKQLGMVIFLFPGLVQSTTAGWESFSPIVCVVVDVVSVIVECDFGNGRHGVP